MMSLMLALVLGTGCAPVTSLPPPVPMAQTEQLDVGCSPVLLAAPETGWAVQCHSILSLENMEPETASRVVGDPLLEWKPKHSEVGITLHRTGENKYGVGFSQRIWFLEDGAFLVGFQGEIGTFWAHASVPLVYRPMDWLYIYTRPTYHVPLGWVAPGGVALQFGELLFSGEARFGKYKDFANEGATESVRTQSYGVSVSWRPKGMEPIEIR